MGAGSFYFKQVDMREITRKDFEKKVKYYSREICDEIIKNGFKGIESWLRVAMSETLEAKINK